MKHETHDLCVVDNFPILGEVEALVHLEIPEQQHSHEDKSAADVAHEEYEVDEQEWEAFRLLVLEHSPTLVHDKASPLAKQVAGRKCHV